MKIRFLLFAGLKSLAHRSEGTVEVCGPQTAGTLFPSFLKDPSAAGRLLPSIRFAINGDYVDAHTELKEGDELAVIPPVSGG